MASLTQKQIENLLIPYLPDPSDELLGKLSLYLDLLLKWNARTNLTAIRSPEEIVTRHFGESLFAARHLGTPATLLDYGSGAGFPGLPIALSHPATRITLAESQNKKSAFLREAVRTLDVPVEVWPRRVEDLPVETVFDCVTLRAVDNMEAALHGALPRAAKMVLVLTSRTALRDFEKLDRFADPVTVAIPNSDDLVVASFHRS